MYIESCYLHLNIMLLFTLVYIKDGEVWLQNAWHCLIKYTDILVTDTLGVKLYVALLDVHGWLNGINSLIDIIFKGISHSDQSHD